MNEEDESLKDYNKLKRFDNMISEKKRPESCTPIYILQNLEGIKKDSGKLEYLKDILERCAIASPTKRRKRTMTGYNCSIKVQMKKTGKPLIAVVKARAWSTFSDKQKSTWNHLALEGCPPRLWEK